ncbi:MAG: Clp protease N-terminal domain-containing protein, partial [FCB group bacterium]
MNFQKFTLKSQEAVQNAREIAVNYNNQAIENVHLFAALLQDPAGIAPDMIMRAGGNLNYIKIKVNELLETIPKVASTGDLSEFISPELAKVFDEATREAKILKDEYVSVEHLVIGLTSVKSKVSQLLHDAGITKDSIYKIMKEIRGTQRVTDQNPEDKYEALKRYGRILNDEAKEGKLDPVIGR